MERKALEKEQRVQTLFASEKGKTLSKSIFPTKYILKQIIRYLKQMATDQELLLQPPPSADAHAEHALCHCQPRDLSDLTHHI